MMGGEIVVRYEQTTLVVTETSNGKIRHRGIFQTTSVAIDKLKIDIL
ncbi:MAG: hypothetical protein PWP57_794 [Candidatus Atribacteria bacterium]|nr:hypothetical protein [Candidatus Atribacteria bacterium]